LFMGRIYQTLRALSNPMLLRRSLVRRHSYHFLSLSRKHSGSAILLVFSEITKAFGTDKRE
jgi:hypothetical protein